MTTLERSAGARPDGSAERADASTQTLGELIGRAAQLLPLQGPITVFVSLNPLQSLEDQPFDVAVKEGARLFGCHPYRPEKEYREELVRGRIRFSELREVLREDLDGRAGAEVAGLGSRLGLRLAMLHASLQSGPPDELRWFVAERSALRQFSPEAPAAVRGQMVAETRRWVMRDLRRVSELPRKRAKGRDDLTSRRPDWLNTLFERFDESAIESWDEADWEAFTLQALWQISCEAIPKLPEPAPVEPASIRHRDLLLDETGTDTDTWVHDVLIRFCAAFLDQGIAHDSLPERDRGLLQAFCSLYRPAGLPVESWRRGLAADLARVQDEQVPALDLIRESLEALGVDPSEWYAFLASTLLALKGWGGMIQQLETRGDRVARPAPPGSLIEFLAVRLLLDRHALAYAARVELGYNGPLAELRAMLRGQVDPGDHANVEGRAFPVFQLAQILGWSPQDLSRLDTQAWASLIGEIEAFPSMERRRIFHQAFERRLHVQTLDALALHEPRRPTTGRRPRFQVITCLDDREESFRRHLEEIAPDAQTFGVAGFFSVAMYYRGAADAHFVPLCPIVIRPSHWVREQVERSAEDVHRRRERRRRAIGTASHQFHVGTRAFAVGALLSAGLGVLATLPLVARILSPRLASRIEGMLDRVVKTPPTRLNLQRLEPDPGPEAGHLGFSIEEMTSIGERMLRDIGLIAGFSRLVLVVGHGSSSVNNPHSSAYDCGACGGGNGGPNARAMAQILNNPEVRERLAVRGIQIPADTIFLGGLHNTCNDHVSFFDVDILTDARRFDFESVRQVVDLACDRNAHERSRRFMSAPLTLSFAAARQHVEGRSVDLAQTRPEYGHSTNALCIVGRRERTQGLYLDRRAFLASYDPYQDDEEHSILTRTLQAAFPVCSGINLQYYFSRVDSSGWGSGTKLPHNITSLIGVMDGAASDLRTGLAWQGVDIHEPIRLLFVIEATPETMLRIMDREAAIGRLCRNGWVRVATLDPESSVLRVFQNGRFVPYQPEANHLPKARSSVDWYRGWRENLEFAEIGS